ncbi:MAG: G8 domain-containing protein, partial [Bdellovibrionia bacterium]
MKRFLLALIFLTFVTENGYPCALHDHTAAEPGATLHGHKDTIPNPVFGVSFKSIASGSWSDPVTWSAGRVPAATDKVIISRDTKVTIDSQTAIAHSIGVYPGGTLMFSPVHNTKLQVINLLVAQGGLLRMGDITTPINLPFTAELVIRDSPLQIGTLAAPGLDTKQYLNGLLVFGSLRIHGQRRALTWARLAAEIIPGALQLRLAEPVLDWKKGDRLFIPDSTALTTGLDETVVVDSISADGMTVQLAQATRYSHNGARDSAGRIDLFPHVANLSRNITIRSENPLGVRGHTQYLHRANVDIRYAAFVDLGRTTADPLVSTTVDAVTGQVTLIGTNQIGRYAVHFHHLMGPVNPTNTGYQYQFVGNAIENTRRWSLTVHNTHYGLIRQNVIIKNSAGAGVVTEDGSESHNEFDRNFVARVLGSDGTGAFKGGVAGDPFWFAGINNRVTHNVAASSNASGYAIFLQHFINGTGALRVARIPRFRGADTENPLEYEIVDMVKSMGLLEFTENEAYKVAHGMNIWNLGQRNNGTTPLPESLILNMRIWHQRFDGISAYNANNLTVDGLVVRGGDMRNIVSNRPLKYTIARGSGFTNVRAARNNIVRNSDIQGSIVGIDVPDDLAPVGGKPGVLRVENCYLQTHTNVRMLGPRALRRVEIYNTVFNPMPVTSSMNPPQVAILKQATTLPGSRGTFVSTDQLIVRGFNRNPAANFDVFYPEQAPSYVVPQTVGGIIGSPVAGLTNAQNWSLYGIAFGGEVARCS